MRIPGKSSQTTRHSDTVATRFDDRIDLVLQKADQPEGTFEKGWNDF
jgi:hypothetical protein